MQLISLSGWLLLLTPSFLVAQSDGGASESSKTSPWALRASIQNSPWGEGVTSQADSSQVLPWSQLKERSGENTELASFLQTLKLYQKEMTQTPNEGAEQGKPFASSSPQLQGLSADKNTKSWSFGVRDNGPMTRMNSASMGMDQSMGMRGMQGMGSTPSMFLGGAPRQMEQMGSGQNEVGQANGGQYGGWFLLIISFHLFHLICTEYIWRLRRNMTLLESKFILKKTKSNLGVLFHEVKQSYLR